MLLLPIGNRKTITELIRPVILPSDPNSKRPHAPYPSLDSSANASRLFRWCLGFQPITLPAVRPPLFLLPSPQPHSPSSQISQRSKCTQSAWHRCRQAPMPSGGASRRTEVPFNQKSLADPVGVVRFPVPLIFVRSLNGCD
jgi:hypothetical protein